METNFNLNLPQSFIEIKCSNKKNVKHKSNTLILFIYFFFFLNDIECKVFYDINSFSLIHTT